MTALMACAFWTIVLGGALVLLMAAIGCALALRDWRNDGGHW